ncbi:TIGR00730 family Rossman fold protein [Coralloluteibacterium stylophorae]|uniref:Cytokinin riboside 5'-monophosphate phosphoribohydrolase n=1 Tax=Coralloluteibacterium stylophorae TaxID=1776034 RepID=A0A8J8AY21_9GAMM|nr:TIGR00730 family Rossman fold protein [Coralloluteibacterium stylophorae]
MSAVCVYCGSNSGRLPVYADRARAFGRALAGRGLELVYGGGRVGLMGTVADAVLADGGRAFGVIPRQLVEAEVAHSGLTELVVVETMHQRKTRMFERAQGFVALPGGFGTMEEIFEVLTWTQLGMHARPCAFLDVAGYYGHLEAMLDHMVAEGFLRAAQRANVWIGDDIDALLDWMQSYRVEPVSKWIVPPAAEQTQAG